MEVTHLVVTRWVVVTPLLLSLWEEVRWAHTPSQVHPTTLTNPGMLGDPQEQEEEQQLEEDSLPLPLPARILLEWASIRVV